MDKSIPKQKYMNECIPGEDPKEKEEKYKKKKDTLRPIIIYLTIFRKILRFFGFCAGSYSAKIPGRVRKALGMNWDTVYSVYAEGLLSSQ